MEGNISGERFIVNGANISYKDLFDQIADGFGVARPTRKVTPLLAEFVWRYKYLKGKLTGKASILNKSTARTSLAICEYDSSKLLSSLPEFTYTAMAQTVSQTCRELIEKYRLKEILT